ncbi:3'-5' exonuclease [Fulvivirga sp. M361]|uniref:3'-5' exonuclease n=1 Tax=Fulvivirga sp. M361 TaxID=2594266 RepID=UPI001179CF38|nr:3'-5' exonuclease [Fulvivirga sp. M361]TRX50880.1 3'-5' exonuclease [Fulvivirga sp. M361]
MGFLSGWFQGDRQKDLPGFALEYLSSCDQVKRSASLEGLRFVVFDTETTSLNVKEARLLSLGAVSCTSHQINIETALDCYVSWEESSRPENVEIHGITKRQSDKGMTPEQLIETFLEYIKGAVLVAHHIDFDVAMVNAVLDKYYKGLSLANPKLDTAQLAIRLEHSRFDRSNVNRKDYTLDALMERFQVTPLERHSALGDAYSTALLLMRLLYRLRKRGIDRLDKLTI